MAVRALQRHAQELAIRYSHAVQDLQRAEVRRGLGLPAVGRGEGLIKGLHAKGTVGGGRGASNGW